MKSYFSHDEGARNDPKLVKVLMRLGQAGKGVYWDLVEMLYEQGGYLPVADVPAYAVDLHTTPELIKSLLFDFGLFSYDDAAFWLAGKDKGTGRRVRMHNKNVVAWNTLRTSVFKRDNYTCQYCGQVGGRLEADHVHPFSKGGADEECNLVTACFTCNRSKRTKSADEFRATLKSNKQNG